MNTQVIELRLRDALLEAGFHKEAAKIDVEDLATVEEETDRGPEEEGVADPDPIPPPTLINLFQHPDSHPYVLDLALMKEYGPEWLEWEPETLQYQIPHDFPTAGVSDFTMEKLNAVKTLHLVDRFWQEWEVFVPVTMALNSLYPDFKVMQVPTVAQCAVAVDTARRLRTEVEWSDEMKVYLEVVHMHDGIFCAVDPLSFVEIDSEDYPVDCAEVSRLWPVVRAAGKPPTGDTTTAEQLRRLFVVQETINEHREQLAAQLPLLLK